MPKEIIEEDGFHPSTKPIPMSVKIIPLTTKQIANLLNREDFGEIEPGQNLGVILPTNTFK